MLITGVKWQLYFEFKIFLLIFFNSLVLLAIIFTEKHIIQLSLIPFILAIHKN